MVFNKPYHSSMEKEIKKAANIVDAFFGSSLSGDRSIPREFIQNCRGLAFLTVVKAGFIWTGKMGTGLVIAHNEDGTWSAPSGIGTLGMGFGAEVGGEVIDFMLVLGSNAALSAFKKGTQLSVGAGLELAVGPYGRAAAANVNAGGSGLSANYTYSHTRGIFAGVGLQGSTIMVRGELNKKFYGESVSPMQILSGSVAPPDACNELFEAIQRVTFPRELPLAMPLNEHAEADVLTPPLAMTPPLLASSIPLVKRSSERERRLSEERREKDPRLKRYSDYQTQEEMYARFSRRKSSLERDLPPVVEGGVQSKAVFERVIAYVETHNPSANVQTFKEACREYGQSNKEFGEFARYLRGLLTDAQLEEFIPDLVRLLPTQDKRLEMWEYYTTEIMHE
jgi:lipid-binding SYLF domain-containing protein